MTIVRRVSSSKKEVRSVRSPSRIAEQGDVNFGTLDATKDGSLVSYDSATNKFVLITADELLSASASDQVLPDDFIDILEEELDLGNIVDNLDGGTF